MSFEFATASRIVFGAGSVRQVAPAVKAMGQRVLIVTGKSAERAASLIADLRSAGLEFATFPVVEEPTTDSVSQGAALAREAECDVVVGFGGGSVIDAGKAVAALLTNAGDVIDYLEVIGLGRPLEAAPAPYVAVPTTAGTGAEVTRNAVLESPEHRVKVSMRSPLMLPRLAVVDPELTLGLPPHLTASTGLDALTQLIEAFVSKQANPFTDGFCREGIARVARALNRAYKNGNDAQAREDMSLAGLLGGLALANAKLGAVHGFAGPLGGMFPAPHGAVCGRLLGPVMEANLRALEAWALGSRALARYDEVASILTGRTFAQASDGVAWVRDLRDALEVPSLSAFGIATSDFPLIAEKAQAASSMKGNPVELSQGELIAILEEATASD